MFQQVFPNVFALISGNGSCNCFLVKGRDKIALVDSGTKSNSGKLLSGLGKLGILPEQVSFVLHTHGHADHFSADFLFGNAKVRMHESDAAFIEKKDSTATAAKAFSVDFFPKIDSFFRKGETINLGNFKLKVLFTPGHTAGSVCFLEQKNKILFSGDTLFNAGVGRTDLPSGNAKQLLGSLELLEKTGFEILCPGHGSVLRRNQLENIVFAKQALSRN